MAIEHIAIIGAGQMGNGIAQVSACAGYKVTMIDIKEEYVEKGMSTIKKSLNKLVSKGRMSEDCLLYTSPSPRDATLSRMPSSA